jgi:hypothetical protein
MSTAERSADELRRPIDQKDGWVDSRFSNGYDLARRLRRQLERRVGPQVECRRLAEFR